MDTGGKHTFSSLLSLLTASVASFPDIRRGKNTQYSLQDITLAAFAVFFCQSPSFLAHQRLMQQTEGTNNGKTVFGMHRLPTDNQIRNLLDPVDPQLLQPVYRSIFAFLRQEGVVDSFRHEELDNTLLVALDGTQYFSSEAIHCDRCMVTRHRDGRVTYAHSALMPAVVKPGSPQVIAQEPEFISPQDGHEKQDCESAAAKRWITRMGRLLGPLGATLLGDGLYATKPMIRLVGEQRLHYIFVAKPKQHKYLYEELEAYQKLGEVQELGRTQRTGKKRRHLVYRYANGVPLNDEQEPVQVNWAELTIADDSGKVGLRVAFIPTTLLPSRM